MSRRFNIQIESDVPNGTAPMIVDSSTLVTNFNADLLDGQHGSYYAPIASPTFTGIVILPTSSSANSSIRIPHGNAPTSPTNGDIWTTTSGLFARINSSTVGPFGIGTARTFYQTTAPSSPNVGDVWVDSDEVYTTINPNDYMPKSGGTFTGAITSPTVSITTADTATAASHYIVETASDGVIRPKTLANARTEIVTTAAVNAAAATTVGTVTSGTWNAGAITTSSLITGNAGVAAEAWTKDDITTRTQSGFIQTATATTAEGWPETTNNWYHLIASTHSNTANYYSLQIAAPFFSNKLYFRSTNHAATSGATTAWKEVATVDQLGSGSFEPFFLSGM